MRISDIVLEAGFIDQFKSAVSMNKQKGFDAVNRIVNPKAWATRSSSAEKSSKQPKTNLKDAVSRVVQKLRIYDSEEQALINAAKAVKNGDIETRLDPAQLSLALKTAGKTHTVNDQQLKLLQTFLQEL